MSHHSWFLPLKASHAVLCLNPALHGSHTSGHVQGPPAGGPLTLGPFILTFYLLSSPAQSPSPQTLFLVVQGTEPLKGEDLGLRPQSFLGLPWFLKTNKCLLHEATRAEAQEAGKRSASGVTCIQGPRTLDRRRAGVQCDPLTVITRSLRPAPSSQTRAYTMQGCEVDLPVPRGCGWLTQLSLFLAIRCSLWGALAPSIKL